MDIPLVAPVLPSMYPASAPQPAVVSAYPSPSYAPPVVQVKSDELDTGTKVLLGLLGVGAVGFGVYMVKKRFDAITAATVKATSDVSTAAAAVQAAAPNAPAPTPAPPPPAHAKKKHAASSTPTTAPKPASTGTSASLPGLSSSGGLLGA